MPFSIDKNQQQLSIRIPQSPRAKLTDLQSPSSPVSPHRRQLWRDSASSSPLSSLSSAGRISGCVSSSEGLDNGDMSLLSEATSGSSGVWSASEEECQLQWEVAEELLPLLKCNGGERGVEEGEEEEEGCSTPKSSESRIPTAQFCPPAPLKRRRPLQCRRRNKRPCISVFIVPDFDAVFPGLHYKPTSPNTS